MERRIEKNELKKIILPCVDILTVAEKSAQDNGEKRKLPVWQHELPILNRPVLFGLIYLTGNLFHQSRKDKEGNRVVNSHETVKGISNIPQEI